ncbi:MAG: type II CAAX endopeptidase family protein [Chloroflexi bacterium]|nr:type II CAAX endopeptidase family protein [Chloroflexota bacterium]
MPMTLPRDPPWGWWEIGKALLLIIVGVIILSLIVVGISFIIHTDLGRTPKLSSLPLFVIATGIYGIVVLAIYWFAVRRAGSSWMQVGLRPFAWWWVPLAPILTFAQFLGMFVINTQLVLRFTGKAFENPQIENITGGMRLTPTDLVLLLLLVAVVAPIAEELLFRGLVYPVLRRSWGVTFAIILSALLFGLAHVIPVLIPGLFFVGLILAWVRERSGSVIPGMLIHALQNGIIIIAIYAQSNL